MQIQEVASKKDLKQFINLPWNIYQNDQTWVPPLKIAVKDVLSSKHPFYETAESKVFIAREDGQVVGRIMAVVPHEYNKFHGEKTGFWGFFECSGPNAIKVSDQLFLQVEEWLKEKGMNKILGPLSPSSNYECGLLIDGFDDPPQIMMTYNPRNYQGMIERAGYEKAKDLLAYQIDLSFVMPEKIQKISERAERSHKIFYRSINKKKWSNEIALMWKIYNDAWENNWGFVPMTEKEFLHTANDLKSVVDEKLILFALADGEEVGFIVALPDYNQVFKKIPSGNLFPTGIFKLLTGRKNIKRCRVITMGVKQKFRRRGLESLMYQKMHENLKSSGFTEAEMSWILEDNLHMNRPLQVMGAKPYKRYRIFQKDI